MERLTISLDDRLAEQFDAWLARHKYANRSEAVRDLLRAELGKTHLKSVAGKHRVACLSYVFKHHERDLAERLTTLHHAHHDPSVSTMHAHLDHCLETAILRGPTVRVTEFAEAVCAERGVHHGKLNIISVELHQPHGGRSTASHSHNQVHVHVKPTS